MRILILNWRDIKNPSAGGAEILTHEMAKRWVAWGHEITQISSRFTGGKNREVIDGVHFVRIGTWWTVHILAFFYFWKNLRYKIDFIIDEVHWFPFFAVFYARQKTTLLVCEVAKNLFFKIFPYPLALFWRAVEKIYLRLYRGVPTLAISFSTKEDLAREGFRKEDIIVLPMGVSIPKNLKVFQKEKKPVVLFLGRLSKQKGINDALEAFRKIKESVPESQLWVVGRGQRKKIPHNQTVRIFGFVPELEKFKLLSRAHVLIVPSVHEGWGLVVVEAGVVGTPAVVYNVAGLRDVINNGRNGLVAEPNPQALAEGVTRILTDERLYKTLQKGARSMSRSFNWENTARVALRVMQKIK